MFMAALLVIVPNLKQPNDSSTGDWINKLWYAYSAIERNYCYHNMDGFMDGFIRFMDGFITQSVKQLILLSI